MSPRDDETLRVGPPRVTVDEPAEADVDDLVGGVVGGYRILDRLGRGGMGVVYLAEDLSLKRRVALKVLPGGIGASPDARARFRREAEAASRLDHPHLCGVIGVGEHAGLRWIAMRYVPGVTLDARLRAEKARRTTTGVAVGGGVASSGTKTDLSAWRDAVLLVETVARAVHTAHEAGVVHRDLKPQNIMVQEDGTPVVLDFGLAQDSADEGLTRTGDVLGTPNYMAPEQVRGDLRLADRRVDVWALGVTLFEMLALRRPFDAPTREGLWRAILEQDPPALKSVARGLPPDLDAVLAVALVKEPDRRYATALLFAEDLRSVLEFRPVRARAPGPIARLAKFARRRPAAALAATLLIVGLPTIAALWASASAQQDRVTQIVTERIAEARDALGLRRVEDAARALAAVRLLDPALTELAPLDAAVDRARAFDAAETLAFDVDADPEGRRALSALDALAAQEPETLDGATLRALVLARTQGLPSARTSLAAFALARPSSGAEPYVAACDRATSRSASSRPGADKGADVDLAFFKALLASAEGDDRAALTLLESLLERAPSRHWIAWAAAETASRLHDFHAALAFAGRARALGGAATPERLARFSTYLRRAGLTDEAIRVATDAVRAGDDAPPLLLHLANALADAKRPVDAEPLLRRATEADPSYAEAWGALGAVLFEQSRYSESIEASRTSLALREDGGVRVNLGNALIESERFGEAEVELRRAVALRPDSAFAWNSLGSSLMHQEKFDEAERAIERAVDLRPTYAEALASLGVVLRRRGDLIGSERRIRAALALAPTSVKIRYQLACAVFDAHPEEAERMLRAVAADQPDDGDVVAKLAEALARRGLFAEAEPLARRGTELRANAVRPWLIRSLIAAALGKLEESAQWIRTAAERGPNEAAIHVGVADVVGTSDPVEVFARLSEAARLDPALGRAMKDRIASAKQRLAELADEDPADVEPQFRLAAAHPLSRALAAESSSDFEERAAVTRDVLALPDGPPGSKARVIRAAALSAAGLAPASRPGG